MQVTLVDILQDRLGYIYALTAKGMSRVITLCCDLSELSQYIELELKRFRAYPQIVHKSTLRPPARRAMVDASVTVNNCP